MRKKITLEEFKERSNKIHNNKYDYSKSIYINAISKIKIICPVHGEFNQKAYDHLSGSECPKCIKQEVIDRNKKLPLLNKEQRRLKFLENVKIVHRDKYDYSEVEYIDLDHKIKIICKTHGLFYQMAGAHKGGQGCSKCGTERTTKKRTFTIDKFIERAREAHGDLYDYSMVQYKTIFEKVKIICKVHGEFEQSPTDHWAGHGCNKCAIEYRARKISSNTEEFITTAKEVHGDRYDYSKVNYVNRRSKVEIICKKHGSFYQRPGYHLKGCNCPVCSRAGVSEMEKVWLDSLGIKDRQVCIRVNNTRYMVDGFDSKTNTVYEFNGDFWHGNPAVYGDGVNDVNSCLFSELYRKTIEKENDLRLAGYNVVVKWETEK